MIIDKIANSGLYSSMSERFASAFEYLKMTNLASLAVGKYEIAGTDVFALVSEYQTKNESEAKWEAHKVYADIQFIISGEEQMGYSPLENMKEKESYNPEKDIVFLDGSGDYLKATPETFLVFFPQDAHKPCVSTGKGTSVKKVVIKVKM